MLLEVKGLHVHYGQAEVVRNISISAKEGTIVTIIGSNGAGKTTTLRAIIGLKSCSAGEILFKNSRIDGKLPQDIVEQGIGFVPEGRDLFPYMTVLENLKLGAFLLRDRHEIDENLEALFKHFPVLKERKQQQAKTLSGGEQQMLAIARALMGNPKLLLLDEPSLGLSPMNVKEIGRIVQDINERGVGVVLVEQNARLALKLAHQCYVMETGSIVLEGDPKELLHSERIRKAYLGE